MSFINRTQVYNVPFSILRFRELLMTKQDNQTSFYEFVESELEVLKIDRALGTISNYNKLLNTLKLWKPTLTFDEITLDFIERFHTHEVKQGNLESTVNKKHANLKFLIGRSLLKEKLARNPYERFSIKKSIKAQNNDILSENEISKLQLVYDQNIYNKGKQEVLRNFLFSCSKVAFVLFACMAVTADDRRWIYTFTCELKGSVLYSSLGLSPSYLLPSISSSPDGFLISNFVQLTIPAQILPFNYIYSNISSIYFFISNFTE